MPRQAPGAVGETVLAGLQLGARCLLEAGDLAVVGPCRAGQLGETVGRVGPPAGEGSVSALSAQPVLERLRASLPEPADQGVVVGRQARARNMGLGSTAAIGADPDKALRLRPSPTKQGLIPGREPRIRGRGSTQAPRDRQSEDHQHVFALGPSGGENSPVS